jgi:hypothetical protein
MAARLKVLATAAALAAVLAPAAHALSAPTPTAPASGAVVDLLPAFAWGKVPGAERYEFQIASDPGFNAPVLAPGDSRFFTGNTRATLKKTVPNGTYYWHVRSVTAEGAVSGWSATRMFRKAWNASAVLQSPASGGTLTFPSNPLRLAWSPVLGAAKYVVSVASDPSLASLVVKDPYESGGPKTQATSFTRGANLAPGTYYWNVAPVDAEGNVGAPSPVASFNWTWPSTTQPAVVDLNAAPEVYDPKFSWNPVPGAARYEVEVNSSSDFTAGSKVCCDSTTIATSLSPTVLFKDNTYYWRVRAIDPDGTTGVWNYGPSFVKTFDKVPPVVSTSIQNLHMRDNLSDPGTDLDGGTPGYQTQVPMLTWNWVPGASSYEVDVTPFNGSFCDWAAPSHHWRVDTAVNAWTPLGYNMTFVKPYSDPMQVANDFSSLAVGQYCARVRARSDRLPNFDEVYGDYTYLDNGQGWAFEWTGYPAGGACSPSCTPNFLGANDYVSPANGTLTTRVPYFTWKPLAGKQSYWVLVAKDPNFSNLVDYGFTQVPAYAARGSLSPRTYPDETTLYYWAILPASNFDGTGAVGNPLVAAARNFQKQSTPPSLQSPTTGWVFYDQPTFRWSSVEGARRYRFQVAQDPTFGNPIDDVLTNATSYSSNSTYPADTVLYWRVRADDENQVGLTWSATGTFQKKLATPVPSANNPTSGEFLPSWTWSPVDGAVSYDVAVDLPDGTHTDITDLRMPVLTPIKMLGTGLFSWRVRANFPKQGYGSTPGPYSALRTFSRTIPEPAGPHSDGGPDHVLLSWQPRLGVKNYHLQIASRADFAYTVEDVTTDNTTYAPLLSDIGYLKGGSLYWRVAAVDAGGNQGDWTGPQTISLLPHMKLSILPKPRRGRTTLTFVRVMTMDGKGLYRARVRITGAGVRTRTVYTGRRGSVSLKLRPRRRGRLTFVATKGGFQPVGVTLRIR